MEEKKLKCISCGKDITNIAGTTRFQCPKCGKYEIIRCKHCRKISAEYRCPSCNFTGPN